MEIAQRSPHPALASHVRSLAGWHERADGPVRRAELPGGRIVLVISFGPTLDVDGRRFTSFVAGLHDTPAITEHAGEGHGIQAYLTPLGARRLLGMPMGELTRQVVELEDLIGGAAGELAELALDCGYYDQAHFNRDFRQFAGCTPTEYLVTSVQDISAIAA